MLVFLNLHLSKHSFISHLICIFNFSLKKISYFWILCSPLSRRDCLYTIDTTSFHFKVLRFNEVVIFINDISFLSKEFLRKKNFYIPIHLPLGVCHNISSLTGFVNSTISRPSGDDPILLNAWVQNNGIVISWLLNSISKDIYASVIFFDSIHDIWLDLKEWFQQSNGPRVFELKHELMNLSQG